MKTTTIRAMSFASHFLLAFVVVSALMTPAVGIAFWGTREAKAVVFAVHGACLALWFVFRLVAWFNRKRLADDDKVVAPRSAWSRFYRFMSASCVKTETFPEGFDMRAFKRRRSLKSLALLVVAALVVWLFYFRIGLAILFAPLLVPMAALIISLVYALDTFPISELSYDQRNAGGKINYLLPLRHWKPNTWKGILAELCKYRLWTGRPALAFAIAYLIVYAAYLVSTPLRPMPLDPPPPELMAKIHPCLLDEEGNVRKRQIVVVKGIRSYEDIECVLTNGAHREFAVVGAMHHPKNWYWNETDEAFFKEASDIAQSAETNLMSSYTFNNQKGLEDWLGRVQEIVEVSGNVTAPQLGFQSVVPDFAASRGEYLHYSIASLAAYRDILGGMRAYLPLCADSGDPNRLQVTLELLSAYSSTIQRESLIGDRVTILLSQQAVSAIIRVSENTSVATDVDSSIIKLASCFGNENHYEKTLWHTTIYECAYSPTTEGLMLPMSGTSFPKALGGLSRRKPRTFGRSISEVEEVRSFLPVFLNMALWCPVLAFFDGYDTSAQMSCLKHRKDWIAVTRSTALDIDDEEFPLETMNSPSTAHPFGRGGLLFGFDHQFGLTTASTVKHWLLEAYYADRYDLVVDAALRLSQFRGEKGRDAASLEEVEEALSWKRGTDGDLEVVYQSVTPPEGAAEGTFAYVIGLKPKDGCRKAFVNTGVAWLVVRNPNFAGTLKRRFMTLEQYKTGEYDHPKKLSWDLRVGDEDGNDDPFVLPSAFFGDDPTALEKAVRELFRANWGL